MKKLNELFITNSNVEIKNIKTNSKEIEKGDLFVCIKGFNIDRHDFANEAVKNGAAALVVNKFLEVDVPQIKVEDTNKELINIVTDFYDNPSKKMNMIGITGTDGKTSTSTIIYKLLNHFEKTGYIGTNGVECENYKENSNNTTPTPEHLNRFLNNFYLKGCKNTVMEAGSEGLAQGRCEKIEFDYSIFTNLTHEHLNFHKTMENYLDAKSILFKQTKKDGFCIINIDDPYSDEIIKRCNGKVLTYGSNKNADFYFFDINIQNDKTQFKLSYKNNIYDVDIPLLGKFNVYNMTAALAILFLKNIKFEDLKKHFKTLEIDGRMTDINLGQDFKVIVDYAHTPNGYLNLFELTKTLKARKTIIVAGSAGERDATKRPVMGKLLVENADYVIFTYEDPRTENPSDIIDQMTKEVKDKPNKFEKIIDRKEAIVKAINIAKKDDMVLILGKGNENYETIGKEKIYFNDVEEAINALKNKN